MIRHGAPVPTASIHARASRLSITRRRSARRPAAPPAPSAGARRPACRPRAARSSARAATAGPTVAKRRARPRSATRTGGSAPTRVLGDDHRRRPRRAARGAAPRCRTRSRPRSRTARPGTPRCARARASHREPGPELGRAAVRGHRSAPRRRFATCAVWVAALVARRNRSGERSNRTIQLARISLERSRSTAASSDVPFAHAHRSVASRSPIVAMLRSLAVKLLSVARTDVGRKRQINEDAFFRDDARGFYVVADGVGGHNKGEIASREAVEQLTIVGLRRARAISIGSSSASMFGDTECVWEIRRLLESGVKNACYMVYGMAELDPEKKGMSTTLSALLIRANLAFAVHVGDSRVYRVRSNARPPADRGPHADQLQGQARHDDEGRGREGQRQERHHARGRPQGLRPGRHRRHRRRARRSVPAVQRRPARLLHERRPRSPSCAATASSKSAPRRRSRSRTSAAARTTSPPSSSKSSPSSTSGRDRSRC